MGDGKRLSKKQRKKARDFRRQRKTKRSIVSDRDEKDYDPRPKRKNYGSEFEDYESDDSYGQWS